VKYQLIFGFCQRKTPRLRRGKGSASLSIQIWRHGFAGLESQSKRKCNPHEQQLSYHMGLGIAMPIDAFLRLD
jgi:hypothetical protein